MPIYRYQCYVCGKEFEEIIFNSESVICQCGGQVRRVMGKPAVHFQGDNFTKSVKEG